MSIISISMNTTTERFFDLLPHEINAVLLEQIITKDLKQINGALFVNKEWNRYILDFCSAFVLKQFACDFEPVGELTVVKANTDEKVKQLFNSLFCLRGVARIKLQLLFGRANPEVRQIQQLSSLNIISLDVADLTFEQEKYKYFSTLTTLEELEIQCESQTIDWIACPRLTGLHIIGPTFKCWTPLTKLQQLKSFELVDTLRQDLTPFFPVLGSWTALEQLAFYHQLSIRDVKRITCINYARLTNLSIESEELHQDSLIHIAKLTMLEHLRVENITSKHVSALTLLTNLTTLRLNSSAKRNDNIWSNENDLLSLSRLTKLKSLSFSNAPQKQGHMWIQIIGTLTHLERLAIYHCWIDPDEDFWNSLLNLNRLTGLRVEYARHLTPKLISQITNLIKLRLWGSLHAPQAQANEIQKACTWLDVKAVKVES